VPESAPEQVTDPAFLTEEFFDARDAVQVKYFLLCFRTASSARLAGER
jgi:hypothetical protein